MSYDDEEQPTLLTIANVATLVDVDHWLYRNQARVSAGGDAPTAFVTVTILAGGLQ